MFHVPPFKNPMFWDNGTLNKESTKETKARSRTTADSDFSMVSVVSKKITMTKYRYQLERYRGRSTRHVCPQCGRKNVFTRYIDTYNNIYINDIVGKCNRLDKCGYHYTHTNISLITPGSETTYQERRGRYDPGSEIRKLVPSHYPKT